MSSASSDVLAAIKSAQSTVDGMSTIDQSAAITLAIPIKDLSSAVDASIIALIGKKDAFDKAGLSSLVLSSLQDQKKASDALTSALLGKLPEALQDTGKQLAKPAQDSLDKGIAAFSSGGGGGGDMKPAGDMKPSGDMKPAGAVPPPPMDMGAPASPPEAAPPAPSSAAEYPSPTMPPAGMTPPAEAPSSTSSCPETTTMMPSMPMMPSMSTMMSMETTTSMPMMSTMPTMHPTMSTSMNASTTTMPVSYTGAAHQQAVGLGALAVGALVAVL